MKRVLPTCVLALLSGLAVGQQSDQEQQAIDDFVSGDSNTIVLRGDSSKSPEQPQDVKGITIVPQRGTTSYSGSSRQGASRREFVRLNVGMTYTQVERILTGTGVRIDTPEGGVASAQYFVWSGNGGVDSGVLVVFDNDRLIAKNSVGLRDGYSRSTSYDDDDDYEYEEPEPLKGRVSQRHVNSLRLGFSPRSVDSEFPGSGRKVDSWTQWEGDEEIEYEEWQWEGNNPHVRSYAVVVFRDGRSIKKYGVGLK